MHSSGPFPYAGPLGLSNQEWKKNDSYELLPFLKEVLRTMIWGVDVRGVDVRGVWLRIFYMHWRRRRTIGGKNATDVMENDHKVVQE